MLDLLLYFVGDIIKYYLIFGCFIVILFVIIELINEQITLDFTDNLCIILFWPLILKRLIKSEE